MIRRCPKIEDLETLLERDVKKVIKHASSCLGCQAVLALLADRSAEIETPECAETEVLAAEREASELSPADVERIGAHISTCESCRLLWSDELP